MWKRTTPQGMKTATIDRYGPFLATFERQSQTFIQRAREEQSAGRYDRASWWAGQARRVITNAERIREATG